MPIATNPYRVGIAADPINDLDVSNQVQKYKDEEASYKAPQVLPFNFNGAQELISILYKDLLDIRNMVLAAERNPLVKTKYTAPILKVIDNIGNEILQDIPELLDKLQLSGTIEHD